MADDDEDDDQEDEGAESFELPVDGVLTAADVAPLIDKEVG